MREREVPGETGMQLLKMHTTKQRSSIRGPWHNLAQGLGRASCVSHLLCMRPDAKAGGMRPHAGISRFTVALGLSGLLYPDNTY